MLLGWWAYVYIVWIKFIFVNLFKVSKNWLKFSSMSMFLPKIKQFNLDDIPWKVQFLHEKESKVSQKLHIFSYNVHNDEN